MTCLDALIESHTLLPLISVLIEISMCERLDPVLVKRFSYEMIKMSAGKAGEKCAKEFFKSEFMIIDSAIKSVAKKFLQNLATILQNLMTAEEAFKVLISANEPFRKTRRRLPPRAETELAQWLKENSRHPYMSEDDIEKFCERYDGAIEADQIRIFLTNARRKMSEGVRKRSKSQ